MDTDKLNKRLESLRNSNTDGKVKEVYNILYMEEIWYIAYQNIYSNKGAFTKGFDNDTLDKIDKNRILDIIFSLKEKNYIPKPIKQICIPKYNGDTRFLNISSGTDKLIQESIRIILESIFEPKFNFCSHGYRPGHSCHTALGQISKWAGIKWFIQFDIKGCFDNLDHKILINLLEEKINDKKFINLISMMLKVGYVNDWKYENTYSGTPQGGILSPILSNIYLNKLDQKIDKICFEVNSKFNLKRERNKDYEKLSNTIRNKLKRKQDLENLFPKLEEIKDKYISLSNEKTESLMFECIELNKELTFNPYSRENPNLYNNLQRKRKRRLENVERITGVSQYGLLLLLDYSKLYEEYNMIIIEHKQASKSREKINSIDNMDENFKRMKYCRYSDDFVIGFIGSISEAYEVKDMVSEFLINELRLELNLDKTIVVNSHKGIRFLGYNIDYRRTKKDQFKYKNRNGVIYKTRRQSNVPVFRVPVDIAIDFCNKNKYGNYVDCISSHKGALVNFDVVEIIEQYNSELRGVANYYKYAIDMKRIIGRIQWLNHYSFAKTLALKYKCSVAKLFNSKIISIKNNFWYIKEKDIERYMFKIKQIERKNFREETDLNVNDIVVDFTIKIRNSAVKKLISDTCEICGANDVKIHQHHKNAVRNTKNDDWFRKVYKLRNRKTLSLCEKCHIKITSNTNHQLCRNK